MRKASPSCLFLFKTVQSFQPKAETFPDLPYKVHACAVRQMISIRLLREFIIQMDVSVTCRRTQCIGPFVRIANHCSKSRDRSTIESSVVVLKIIVDAREIPLPGGARRSCASTPSEQLCHLAGDASVRLPTSSVGPRPISASISTTVCIYAFVSSPAKASRP